MDAEVALITKDDVGTWFGVTFEQGREWRARFHSYVRIRATFPFWNGKVLVGKLWQDLLQESGALLGPINYQDAALNNGVNAGQIANAVNHAAEKMIVYFDMLKIREKLELCRHLLTCDDIVRISEELLALSPKRRISFGGNVRHDVILYLYACQVYFDEVRKVLVSLRASIPFDFRLAEDDETEEAVMLAEEAECEMGDGNFARALILVAKGLEYSPFCFGLYAIRGMCHIGVQNFEAADWDGCRCLAFNLNRSEGYIVRIITSSKIGGVQDCQDLMCAAALNCPGDEKLFEFFRRNPRLLEAAENMGLLPRQELTPIRDIAKTEVRGTDEKPATPVKVCPSPKQECSVDRQLNEAEADAASLRAEMSELKKELADAQKQKDENLLEWTKRTQKAQAEILKLKREKEEKEKEEEKEEEEEKKNPSISDDASENDQPDQDEEIDDNEESKLDGNPIPSVVWCTFLFPIVVRILPIIFGLFWNNM